MTPAQCRAGRAFVNMSLAQLAAAVVVPILVIFDFEGGWGKPKGSRRNPACARAGRR
jgi:hypothetical protein